VRHNVGQHVHIARDVVCHPRAGHRDGARGSHSVNHLAVGAILPLWRIVVRSPVEAVRVANVALIASHAGVYS